MYKHQYDRMFYRGYLGSIELQEDGTYYGKLLNVGNDLITYGSDNMEDLYEEFIIAIEDYEKTCKELGREVIKEEVDIFNL